MSPTTQIAIAMITSLLALTAALASIWFQYWRESKDPRFMAERVAKALLNNPSYPFRSFRILRHHIGGFEDEELRRILVRAGAIRTMSASGQELWILMANMARRTTSAHAFFWKIDQDPNAPDEAELFPTALPKTEAAHTTGGQSTKGEPKSAGP